MRSPTALACLISIAPALGARAGEPTDDDGPPRVELESRIERVLVYSSGAAVTRSGERDIPAGRSRIVVAGLPPALRADTFRAKLEGAGGAGGGRILSVDYGLEPSVKPTRGDEKALAARLDALDLELKAVNDERALLNGRAELVNSLSLAVEAPAAGGCPPEAPALEVDSWKSVLDYSETEVAASLARLRDLNERARVLEGEVKETKAELGELRSRTVPAVATAVVEVESPAAARARLLLTYSVGNVAWFPAYSFRMDPEGRAGRMVRLASVAQNTGEDWRDAELVFSSGIETRVASIPELRSWLIVERATGGGIEPRAAGDREPGETVIERPGVLPPAADALMESPLAALGLLGAGRLGEAFGYEGLGSLGQTLEDMSGVSDIPLGGSGIVGNLGVGGGGAGAFGFRRGGGRRRVALRGGGSRRSESSVDGSLNWLPRRQEEDGRWSSRAAGGGVEMDEADTALAVLAMLGAGHTERHGKYSESVAGAIAWLVSRQGPDGSIGADLWSRSLACAALSEAYGMGRVEATGRAAGRAADALAREIASAPWPLQPGLAGSAWPEGPENIAFVTIALKSAKIAGLEVPGEAFMRVISIVDEIDSARPSPLNSAAVMLSRQFLGWKRTDRDLVRHAKTLARNLPRWEPGRMDFRYFYLGTLGMFQMGGDYWKAWNGALRDMLVSHQEAGGADDGSWPPLDKVASGSGIPGTGASRVYSTAMCAMCLEVYYRYLPLYKGQGAGGGGPGEEEVYVPPVVSSGGRDFRSRALKAARVPSDGKYRSVALERRRLDARVFDIAVPVEYRGAFLRAEVANDSAEPLLAGEADVYLGEDFMGAMFLRTTPAGEHFEIPLGLDPGIELARRSTSERKELGLRNRTRRTDYEVTIEARNRKARAVDLVLVDRLPVSTDERVRVVDASFRGGKVTRDPECPTGEVRFELELAPGETKAARMRYAVEHPSDVEALGRRAD